MKTTCSNRARKTVKALSFLLCLLATEAGHALPISVYKTMADLRSHAAITSGMAQGTTLSILGYYNANDGGGGEFYLNLEDTDADNGGTIIAPATGASLGRWVRVCPPGKMNVLWFGARPWPNSYDTAPLDSYPFIISAYHA